MKKQEFSIIVSLAILAIIFSGLSIIATATNTNFLKSLTGHATAGNVTAHTDEMMIFELSPSGVNFGNITQNSSKDTLNVIPPFIINNTGNVKLDMTVNSSNTLLKGTSPTYAFNSSCSEASCAGTVYSSWTTFTQAVQDIVKILEFNDSMDALRIDLKIIVPADEPAGPKTDTLTFTASEAAEESPALELPYIYYEGSKLYIYPEDSSTGIVWSPTNNITGAQSNTNGSNNAITIVNYYGPGSYAAQVCSDLSFDGYNDWYLPAINQLSEMYSQKNNVTKGDYTGVWADFVADSYWSSTEDSGDDPEGSAWNVDFNIGYPDYYLKYYPGSHVRCVRSD
jgi:hypothetical protein